MKQTHFPDRKGLPALILGWVVVPFFLKGFGLQRDPVGFPKHDLEIGTEFHREGSSGSAPEASIKESGRDHPLVRRIKEGKGDRFDRLDPLLTGIGNDQSSPKRFLSVFDVGSADLGRWSPEARSLL